MGSCPCLCSFLPLQSKTQWQTVLCWCPTGTKGFAPMPKRQESLYSPAEVQQAPWLLLALQDSPSHTPVEGRLRTSVEGFLFISFVCSGQPSSTSCLWKLVSIQVRRGFYQPTSHWPPLQCELPTYKPSGLFLMAASQPFHDWIRWVGIHHLFTDQLPGQAGIILGRKSSLWTLWDMQSFQGALCMSTKVCNHWDQGVTES